ncbi:TetR/AcrR family transcriptional regulator [Micromonospora chalcea]|uniref:TetR/AcrR family transcriptional regulator n=1 Tax=Micromonospora chalcea TaxID=1874 RepID=UPI001656A534|nr:TetR/AcrR family transcriptional regulator [Micromonospora chalcea]
MLTGAPPGYIDTVTKDKLTSDRDFLLDATQALKNPSDGPDAGRTPGRAEILAAAARLFAANGLHATTLTDVLDETGVPADTLHRHFGTREQLIAAVADQALATTRWIFDDLLADGAVPSPEHALREVIETIDHRFAHRAAFGVDLTRVGVQVWAEALINPVLADRAEQVHRQLRGHFSDVVRRWQAAGNTAANLDPDRIGTVMLSLVQGFVLQRLLIRDTTAEAYLTGVRGLLSMGSSPAEPTP